MTETLEQFTKRINDDMEHQRKHGGTIYGAVGKALDDTKTADIAKWDDRQKEIKSYVQTAKATF